MGLDNLAISPRELLKDCLYECNQNGLKRYYITNALELDKTENKKLFKESILNDKVFIDGWTATINATLQEYKEDIKIIF
ncbi:MAG: hypothetical protein LBT07_00795 [Endomicrobium sp.]|jgi:adenine-specific DNA-methyltransferase|nr:hypothetical protein [Endomicrobium sp.]